MFNAYLYGSSHVEALGRRTILLRLSTSVIYACRQSVCSSVCAIYPKAPFNAYNSQLLKSYNIFTPVVILHVGQFCLLLFETVF